MGVGTHVGDHAQTDVGHFARLSGKVVDDLQLGQTLHVEAKDAFFQTKIDFPVFLAHSRVDNALGGESCVECGLDLASAHAVGPHSVAGDEPQHFGIGIGLHRIVYGEALMPCSLLLDGL